LTIPSPIDAVSGETRAGLDQMNAQCGALQRTMFQASVVLIVALVGMIAARL
jgi:hypothetical protein